MFALVYNDRAEFFKKWECKNWLNALRKDNTV